MRKLVNKPNVDPPDSTFPYGRIKDRSGVTHGTPVTERVYGDMHQFFEKLLADATLIGNDLPDNAYNGFQLNEAVARLLKMNLISAGLGGVDVADGLGGGSKDIPSGHDVRLLPSQDSKFHGGFYSVAPGALNVPIAGQDGHLIVIYANAGAEAHIFISTTQLIYFNVKVAGSWLGWIQIAGNVWTDISLINGWNQGSVPNAGWSKVNGRVWLRGNLASNGSSSNIVTAAGAVPNPNCNVNLQLAISEDTTGFAGLNIRPDGTLQINIGYSAGVHVYCLEGINYSV